MSKFIIYAGREFKSDFTVVSSDGTTPEQLSDLDTATITISTSGENPECIIDKKDLVLIDKDNGLFELTLDVSETLLLKQNLGFQEDDYSPIGNYNGFLDFILKSGNRQAMITISVQEVGSCPIITP